jgi:hypothetical protein
MNKTVRLLLMVVLTVNAAGGAILLLNGIPAAHALSDDATEQEQDAPTYDKEALRLLGEQLAKRSEQLELREAELEELVRSEELLKRTEHAALATPAGQAADEQPEQPETIEPAATPAPEAEEPTPGFAFEKLQRAYENMEPDSAALALAELAYLDQEAVVQLLISWPPRTSGAILDALTQADPMLAANLSYEIWKKGGNNEAVAANDGR